MSLRVRVWLLLVLAAAATARLWMQIAAMPPYAGLDEIYHVARLSFVLREGRNPSKQEPSVPPYVAASIAGRPTALPAFGVVATNWPHVVKTRPVLHPDSVLTDADLAPYHTPNYEAQQPSLYYTVAAQVARFLPERTPLRELKAWRIFSIVCALIAILAIAAIAVRWFGAAGFIAAALLISTPTWLTLVARASNDALACAFLALACAVTFSGPRHWRGWLLEGALWALAFVTKLYCWPAAVALPLIWRAQRASRWRWGVVMLAGAAAVGITLLDFASRTDNPLGLEAFDRSRGTRTGSISQIDFGSMIKIIVASAAWTSAQHWNALRPLAILLYLGPLIAIVAFFAIRRWRESKHLMLICAVTVAGFALAQMVHAAGYVRQALAEGSSIPSAGKEGWYWFVLAPILIGLLALPLRYAPRLVVLALAAWLIGWDVLIHEGALFQDFAGLTNATGGDALFRWGPRKLPFTYGSLGGIGVGPGASALTLLRAIELVLVFTTIALALRNVEQTLLSARSDGGADRSVCST